jgi:hypothetical protein
MEETRFREEMQVGWEPEVYHPFSYGFSLACGLSRVWFSDARSEAHADWVFSKSSLARWRMLVTFPAVLRSPLQRRGRRMWRARWRAGGRGLGPNGPKSWIEIK